MGENTAKTSSLTLFLLLALHAICGVVILWLLLKLVPQYEKIFKDFNAQLPDVTKIVIGLSRMLGRYWFILVPGLAAGDVAIMLALNCPRHARLMTVWGVAVGLTEVLLIAVILLATFVPLIGLINNLAK